MAYITSNDIYMFPVANRGGAFPLSRLTTEQNIVNILKSMSDKDGFVISPSGSVDMSSSALFEFIIGGYYVKTANSSLASIIPSHTSVNKTLYACLQIASYGSTIADGNQEILSQSASSSYGNVNDDGTIDMNSVQFDNSLDDPTPTDFYGISFEWASSTPSGYTKILPILYWDGEHCIIKEEYRYKIDRNSVDNQWIDLTQQS